ncbi:MAG: hypothetical protein RI947_1507 [Candidatus Parcubacteria bacterium]
MNFSTVTNQEAMKFLSQFFGDRAINKEFYQRVPKDMFDFRMVDTPRRKSDSPRESIAHQIITQRTYMNAIKTGILKFGEKYPGLTEPAKLSKEELLQQLDEAEKELVSLLSDPHIEEKKAKVPWTSEPVPVLSMIWALDSHEILHTGWNLAVMDHLGIERFPKLKEMWG